MKKSARLSLIAIVIVVVCGSAYAQFAKPDEAVGYRKAVMKIIGHHFGMLAGSLKAEKGFDQAAFARNAGIAVFMSGLPVESTLIAGADQDSALKPDALKEKEGFSQRLGSLRAEAQKLSDAVPAGDQKVIKAQFGQVLESCKSCHGAYRR